MVQRIIILKELRGIFGYLKNSKRVFQIWSSFWLCAKLKCNLKFEVAWSSHKIWSEKLNTKKREHLAFSAHYNMCIEVIATDLIKYKKLKIILMFLILVLFHSKGKLIKFCK